MSITGDTTIYGQANNITGENTALYGLVSSDVLNITDEITFQPYGSGDSGVDSNYITFNNSTNTGTFNNKLSTGDFEFDFNGVKSFAIASDKLVVKDSLGVYNDITYDDLINGGSGLLNSTNTWTAENTFSQQSGLLARSSWATGGVIGNLNRDVGKCLTPIDYNPTTKEWSINDEVNGGVLTVDMNTSTTAISTGLVDCYYDVKVGGNLINQYGDIISPSQLAELSLTSGALVDQSSGQNIFGIKYVMNQWTFSTPPIISGGYVNTSTAQTVGGDKTFTGQTQTNALTVNQQLYLSNSTDINWQYSALDNSVTMKDGFGTPIFRINNDTLTSSIGSIAIGQYASFNQIGQIPTNSNVAIGYQALYSNPGTSGGNFCSGYQSGYSLTSGDSNTFIGDLAAKFCTSATECVGIGGGSFRSVQSMGTRCVGIGFNTFPQCVGTLGTSNLAIGAGAGAVITGTGAASVTSCIFIGVNSGVQSNTTSYTNSIAIGFNSRVLGNNGVYFNSASNTVVYTSGWYQKRNMIWRDSPAVLNANLDISSLNTNFYSYYPVNLTANRTVTFNATSSSNWSGLEITFRRVGTGSSANQLLSANNDVLPANSTTPQNVILGAGQHYVKLVNLLVSVGTYYWCVVSIA